MGSSPMNRDRLSSTSLVSGADPAMCKLSKLPFILALRTTWKTSSQPVMSASKPYPFLRRDLLKRPHIKAPQRRAKQLSKDRPRCADVLIALSFSSHPARTCFGPPTSADKFNSSKPDLALCKVMPAE